MAAETLCCRPGAFIVVVVVLVLFPSQTRSVLCSCSSDNETLRKFQAFNEFFMA